MVHKDEKRNTHETSSRATNPTKQRAIGASSQQHRTNGEITRLGGVHERGKLLEFARQRSQANSNKGTIETSQTRTLCAIV